jgi:hypothetical protein
MSPQSPGALMVAKLRNESPLQQDATVVLVVEDVLVVDDVVGASVLVLEVVVGAAVDEVVAGATVLVVLEVVATAVDDVEVVPATSVVLVDVVATTVDEVVVVGAASVLLVDVVPTTTVDVVVSGASVVLVVLGASVLDVVPPPGAGHAGGSGASFRMSARSVLRSSVPPNTAQ